jgi:hypothetical protein
MTIVNYTSGIANKLEAWLTEDARVIIYDHHVFIVQATGLIFVGDYTQSRHEAGFFMRGLITRLTGSIV